MRRYMGWCGQEQIRGVFLSAVLSVLGPACTQARVRPVPPLESQKALLGLVERGCTGGDAEACFGAANAARRGTIGPADAAAATRWMRAGCALDPSGGGTAIAVKLASANPAQLGALGEAGCTGEPAPPRSASVALRTCDEALSLLAARHASP